MSGGAVPRASGRIGTLLQLPRLPMNRLIRLTRAQLVALVCSAL